MVKVSEMDPVIVYVPLKVSMEGCPIENLETDGLLEAILNRTPGVAPTMVMVLELLEVVEVAVPTKLEVPIIVVMAWVKEVRLSVPSAV